MANEPEFQPSSFGASREPQLNSTITGRACGFASCLCGTGEANGGIDSEGQRTQPSSGSGDLVNNVQEAHGAAEGLCVCNCGCACSLNTANSAALTSPHASSYSLPSRWAVWYIGKNGFGLADPNELHNDSNTDRLAVPSFGYQVHLNSSNRSQIASAKKSSMEVLSSNPQDFVSRSSLEHEHAEGHWAQPTANAEYAVPGSYAAISRPASRASAMISNDQNQLLNQLMNNEAAPSDYPPYIMEDFYECR